MESKVVLFPQNREWIKTADMVREIAEVSGKHIRLIKEINPCVSFGKLIPGKVSGLINKAFGNNCYKMDISEYAGIQYQVRNFKESINRTEK